MPRSIRIAVTTDTLSRRVEQRIFCAFTDLELVLPKKPFTAIECEDVSTRTASIVTNTGDVSFVLDFAVPLHLPKQTQPQTAGRGAVGSAAGCREQ